MKDPIRKRFWRELRGDAGKYIALFLFLTLTIGFVSGFMVADGSMLRAYNESFEKYHIEDGHFTAAAPMEDAALHALEQEAGTTLYPLFSIDRETDSAHTVRFYRQRTEVNRVCLMDGAFPARDGEICIDRLYAQNNELSIGDTMTVSGRDYTISGVVAFSDYSALYKNNTDMMFDANKFTVALVTDADFDALGELGKRFTYAWTDPDAGDTDKERRDRADALLEAFAGHAALTDFVPRDQNFAINFAGDDMGSDRVMFATLLYIMMAILGFVFAVTTRGTIEQEASTIGTLKASGYTNGELLRHYLALPTVVTLAAAVIGNILGYTCMKRIVVFMYYHSYSLPTYRTIWNGSAFLLTTVIPVLIIFVLNLLVISMALRFSPLEFLRHELTRRKSRDVVRLRRGSFLSRFRTRVVLQNLSGYLTLFVGVVFVSVLLVFGMMFRPLMDHFKADVVSSMIAQYQYVLKTPVETADADAERYSVQELEYDGWEKITVYGVQEGSRYVPGVRTGEVVLSDGFMEKYGIRAGDTLKLSDPYDGKDYRFRVGGAYHYPAAMSVFLSEEDFNRTFDREPGSFNGWFSNRKLTDLPEEAIATTITQSDLTVMADQLDDSMGFMFPLFCGFGFVIYVLMIYLLAKMIIDRNARSISMLKILGYHDGEAGLLYNRATALVTAISLLLAIPLTVLLIKWIYYAMMKEYAGWLTFYVAPWVYPVSFAFGAAGFALVTLLLMRRVRRIPLSIALKTLE